MAGSGSPRQQAEAIYRFVRDQIENSGYGGVSVDPDRGLGKVLSERSASRAEKALLLQAMLKAVKIDSRLVWAADRDRGAVDPALPNPNWFDTVLVLLQLDGKPVYLDPSDRALGFGRLRAGYEGTPALIPDAKKPEGVVLPETPFDQNLRRAEIDLTLDAKGRLAGTGTLRLTGHHAWEKTDWKADEAKTIAGLEGVAGKALPRVPDLRRQGGRGGRTSAKVTVTWSLTQREEEALGDEVTIAPSVAAGAARPAVRAGGLQPAHAASSSTTPTARRSSSACAGPRAGRSRAVPQEKNVAGGAAASATDVEVKAGRAHPGLHAAASTSPSAGFDTSQRVRGRPLPVRRRGEERCADAGAGPQR